jgi:antirestriction protein ArdC
MARINPYEIITNRIMELLEQGTVPWQKPWNGEELAQNLISKRPYRGINCFLLNIAGYGSPFWATINQINKLGGRVIKGQKSTPVVFWKWLEIEDNETEEVKEKPFLRYYRVFNLEQTKGVSAPESDQPTEIEFNPIARCERLINDMPNKPLGQHKHQAAWYKPSLDLINMPRPETFQSEEEYYSTFFHELAHSTGHHSRLNRPTLTDMAPFGSTNYSKEELVAEMTAAMLCGVSGIENRTIDNSAAYVNGWLKKLKNDKRLVVLAAAQAQKAADCIQGVKHA